MKAFLIFILLTLLFIVPLAMITFGALILCLNNTPTTGQVFVGTLLMMFGLLFLIVSVILAAIGVDN